MLFFCFSTFLFPKANFLFNFFIDIRSFKGYNENMNTNDYKTQFLFHINREHRDAPLVFGEIRLVQIGRMFCSSTTRVGTHVHLNWFELTIVTGGKGEVEVNGVKLPVKEGDLVLSLPCDSHAVYSDKDDPLKYDFFTFFTVNEEKRERLEKLSASIYSADKRIAKNEKIGYLVATALEELDADLPDGNFVLTAIFQQLLTYLLRTFEGQTSSVPAHLSDSEILCFKVTHYLDTHIYTLKNLYELSDITNYNYSYLSAIFKSTTGMTIAEYFRNKKLEAATQLLKERKLKVREIAELLNYSSIYAFSKAYKERFGVSPRDVR